MSDLQVMSMSFLAQQLAEDQKKQELIEELHSKLGLPHSSVNYEIEFVTEN